MQRTLDKTKSKNLLSRVNSFSSLIQPKKKNQTIKLLRMIINLNTFIINLQKPLTVSKVRLRLDTKLKKDK